MVQYISNMVRRAGQWKDAVDLCVLNYDERFLRRKKIETRQGKALLIDLAHTTSLEHGDALETVDGQLIEIVAAEEDLLQITGDLVQLAWHIGNRHTPCQIEQDCLLIQNDPVIIHMLKHLGGVVTPVRQAFTPEGGAYGHGRTHSHEHVATAHEHKH